MPFNLHHLRHPILYHCPADADDETRKRTRERLASRLEEALRAVLTSENLFRSSLGKPTPLLFSARASEDGHGRFRARNEPLGVNDGHLGHSAFEVRLAQGPVIWFRLMPELDPGRTWSVTDLKKIATGAAMLTPLDPRHSALRWVRSDDGFGVYATRLNEKSDEACSVVFAFKTGEVWAIDALLLSAMVHDGQKFIPDLVPLAAVAERAPSLQRTAPSWRAKVPCSGRRRFTDGVLAHVGTPGGPTSTAQPLLRLARSPPTPCLCPSLTQSNRQRSF